MNATKEKFNDLLEAHGQPRSYSGAAKKSGVGVLMMQTLSEGKLPPNHPYLADVAERLHIPVDKLSEFAHGKSMDESQVQRLQARLAGPAHGRRPRTKVAANGTSNGKRSANLLVGARETLGLTRPDIHNATGVSIATLAKLEAREIAPNSPVIAAVAAQYKLSVDEIAAFMKVPPMSALKLAAQRTRLGSHYKTSSNGHQNGHQRPAKGTFRKMGHDQREQLRTLTNTVNVNCLKGVKETTVSTQMLADFLREYYRSRGVEATVVLDFVFDRMFD